MRGGYLVRRVFALVVTAFLAFTFSFILFRALPGSAVTNISRIPNARPKLRQALASEFGLNQSLATQYVKYLNQILHFNLGVSFYNQQPVVANLRSDILNTFEMVLLGTVVAMLFGIFVGVIASWRRGTVLDHGLVLPSLVLYAMPVQWLGLMLIVLFGSTLPSSGRVNNFLIDPSSFQHFTD